MKRVIQFHAAFSYLAALLCLFAGCKTAQVRIKKGELLLSSVPMLMKAAASAKPGDRLLVADGVYKDVKLIVSNSGTPEKPIQIAAQHQGKVFFTGDAKVELRGEYLILDGISFKDGNRNPAEWKSHGPGLVALYGSYNRVTNCAFDNFDEVNSAWITTSLSEDGKVPQRCRIDHCSFTNKLTFDQVINLNNTQKAASDSAGGGPPMYHRIDHNFFSNPPKPGNAGGGIRVGYSRFDTGRCLIDSNLFVRQDSEPEIITSKSQENVYYANTMINCQGTLNFRHGDKQVAINNFFIGTDTSFGYGGMFVWGGHHYIGANYFDLPRTLDSRGNAALYLNPGAPGTEHALACNILVANNLFFNHRGYAVHFNPLDRLRRELSAKNGWVFQTPYHIRFYHNLFYAEPQGRYALFRSDYSDGRDQTWENNLAFTRLLGVAPMNGIQINPCQVAKEEGLYRVIHCPDFRYGKVTDIAAIEGIALDFNELVSRGVTGRPLSLREVGPSWLSVMPPYAKTGKLSADLKERQERIIERAK